jgi:hypothetical protein
VVFLNFEFVLLHNIERPLDSTSICNESNFLGPYISNDRDFRLNGICSSHILDNADQLICISVAANPITIHENLDKILILENLGTQNRKILNSEILQNVSKGFGL